MFSLYKCPNEKCWWDGFGNEGEHCPECGKKLEKFGLRKGNKLAQAKKKSESAKLKKEEDKKKKELEREASKPVYTGESIGKIGDVEETFIVSDTGIRVEKKSNITGRDKGFEEIRYSDITNINLDKGIFSATVKIKYRGGKYKIPGIIPEAAEAFVHNVKEKIQSDTSTLKTETTSTPMDEIKKAKELLDIGAITQEQFDEIRDKYLGQI